MQPIDIVVTYLDDSDPTWIEEFKKYKQEEIGKGIIEATNAQAFGDERIRNWDNMKYWFRGIETNCPWVNKIFFICQKPSQIPKWLDTSNPKLRIIHHEDYIPKELLPTFNTMTIQTFIPLIEDLSENYIYFDDDIFCLNPVPEDMFYTEDDKPRHKNTPFWGGQSLYSTHMGAWGKNLDNTYNMEIKYGDNKNYKYAPYHLPGSHKKSISKKILTDNWNEIVNTLKTSKFRHETYVCPIELYTNCLKRLNLCYIDNNMYNSCKYVTLDEGLNFNLFRNFKIICFNDTETTRNFPKIKQELLKFLNDKLPNKSSFEKED